MYIHVGAEFSFRQREFNRLFRKPTIHVRIFLIAKTTFANAIAKVQSFITPNFAFAPIAA